MAKKVKTVCPYCGVGCGMVLDVEENTIVSVSGDKTHPANYGRLCAKGLTVHQTVQSSDRLSSALIRSPRDSPFHAISLNEAIQSTAARLLDIRDKYGSDAIAFYVSGQLTTEAQYAANKLCKGYIGTNNIDSNSRLCMSSAASGYKTSLGADAPPGCYDDIEHSNLFFVIGANMADCHPILFYRLLERREKHQAKLIVVDPRRTATAEKADLYLPVRPGSDLALLNGLAYLLVRMNKIDCPFIDKHTEGWDSLWNLLRNYTPPAVSEITGISIEQLVTAAQWIADAPEWMTLWTMGLNQSTKGTFNTNAICNLHLLTGKISRPGSGPFSLTGQPNAMGGREVGYLSHGLPGQRTVESSEHRSFIENLWGIRSGSISPRPGMDAVSLFRALEEGSIKAVWIVATNPVATMPNRQIVINGLKKAEFVVVQDAYHPTETTHYADVLLPGALWAESEGTFVNSERRVALLEKAIQAEGDAIPDWQIITLVAQAMGFGSGFPYKCAEEIFAEMAETCNPETEYDLRGMSYEKLRQTPQQWPCSPGSLHGQSRRYRNASTGQLNFPTPSGRAKLWARPYTAPAEIPSEEHSWTLTNGRLPHQWHTRTKTGKVEALNKLNPAPFVQINPRDARHLGIQSEEPVQVQSSRGCAVLPARLEEAVQPGQCFIPIHWNDLYDPQVSVNQVTNDARDPLSLQPELKVCAVKLSPLRVQEAAETGANNQGEGSMNVTDSKTESFTNEQKEYLQGLLAGYMQRGLFVPQSAEESTADQEPSIYGKPLSELCREEKVKWEENPLDIWEKIESHAEMEQFPKDGDVFRFKFHGLFYVAPTQEAFMLRCRIPAGILTSAQMKGLADIAEKWGGGYADITTRANIQIREIQAKNSVNVLTRLYDIGLTSRGSGADNIRNITASPTSGIELDEVFDVRQLAKGLHHHILNNRDLYGLPRKFNVAFDNGGAISVVGDTNDIGLAAVRVGGGHEVPAGVYFRLLLGGITGHGQFAQDSGILLKPQECIAVILAMIRVYIENGDRSNRKKARLKYLLDAWGVEKFLTETEKKLPFPLLRFPLDKCRPRRHTIRHGHIGVYRQAQPEMNYIGVAIPVGRMTAKQMRQLADLAQTYGSGELRLTVWQNLIIPHISEIHVETVKRQLVKIGFHYSAGSILGGLVACTGNTGCRFASTNTKGQALELANYLEKKVALDRPINIHLTGCPHSCAQHYCGDIGLLGVKVSMGGESVEGYNIVLGGGVDQDQGLAKEVFKNIPFSQIPALLEKLLNGYLDKRTAHETFIEFARRHSVKEIQEMVS